MLDFRPYRKGDLDGFEFLQEVLPLNQQYSPDTLHEVISSGYALVGLYQGEVIGAAGHMDLWFGRARVWCMIGKKFPQRAGAWKQTADEVRMYLDYLHHKGFHRLETTVRHDFAAGHRWAQSLGFVNETPDGMRKYMPDGSVYSLYAKVQ